MLVGALKGLASNLFGDPHFSWDSVDWLVEVTKSFREMGASLEDVIFVFVFTLFCCF